MNWKRSINLEEFLPWNDSIGRFPSIVSMRTAPSAAAPTKSLNDPIDSSSGGREREIEIFAQHFSAQGRPKAPPGDAKCVTEILGGGDKNKKVKGTKFKFDQLILSKITKMVATRCHILRLKCTKFYFGWGSAPDPAHSVPKPPNWV